MKKVLIAVMVAAAGLFFVSVAGAQFGNIKVPTSVSDVQGNVSEVEYTQCKDLIGKYDNNVDYTSKNLFNLLESNKDVRLVKYSKDYSKSANKWDKENMVKEGEFNYKNTCSIRANCTKEKCNVYCNKK